MRILITGATGFLGSSLAQAFFKEGHDLVILKRSNSRTARIDNLLPHVTCYDADRCDLSRLFLEQSPIDTVLHTAACYGRGGESCVDLLKVNVEFSLQLLEMAAVSKVRFFFNAGTSLDPFLSPYALSKKQFAEWGRMVAEQGRISFTNVRLEHFYGPHDDNSKSLPSLFVAVLRTPRNFC